MRGQFLCPVVLRSCATGLGSPTYIGIVAGGGGTETNGGFVRGMRRLSVVVWYDGVTEGGVGISKWSKKLEDDDVRKFDCHARWVG